MEFIVVGDVHARPTDLGECEDLARLVLEASARHPAATPLFLGDQFHTHDVMSVRVMEWWRSVATRIAAQGPEAIFLVGNHDQSRPGAAEAAMSCCSDLATIVNGLLEVGPVLLASYCSDGDFTARTIDRKLPLLVCHQDLAGSVYDDSVTASRSTLSPAGHFSQVISGHLHAPQEHGRLWYPGSPRWLTRSDASVAERAVWWVEVSEDGRIARRIPYSTFPACRRIVVSEDLPHQPATLVPGADNRVVVRGTADHVERRRRELSSAGAIVTASVVHAQAPTVRESEGVVASMRQHLRDFVPTFGTSRDRMVELVKEAAGIDL